MSYIEIEIGGKLRGLKFNQGALIMFQGKVDKDNYVGTAGYGLVWAGLKSNAYVKGEEFTESFETVCDWVDLLSPETLTSIMNSFKETQSFKKVDEEPDKKKSQLKNTKRSALK